MTTIRASYAITSEDVGAWMSFWRENDPRRRRLSRILRALGFLSAVYLAFRTAQYQASPVSAAAAFIVVAALLIGVMQASRLGSRDWTRLARKHVPEEASPSVYGDHEIELDDLGFKVNNSFGKSQFSWDAISRIEETDTHLFLYLAPNQALVIPAASLRGSSLEEITTKAKSSSLAAV